MVGCCLGLALLVGRGGWRLTGVSRPWWAGSLCSRRCWRDSVVAVMCIAAAKLVRFDFTIGYFT